MLYEVITLNNQTKTKGWKRIIIEKPFVITSYSIHYTKLYEDDFLLLIVPEYFIFTNALKYVIAVFDIYFFV